MEVEALIETYFCKTVKIQKSLFSEKQKTTTKM